MGFLTKLFAGPKMEEQPLLPMPIQKEKKKVPLSSIGRDSTLLTPIGGLSENNNFTRLLG